MVKEKCSLTEKTQLHLVEKHLILQQCLGLHLNELK